MPVIQPRRRVDVGADCVGGAHARRMDAPLELVIPRVLMFICDMPEKKDAMCAAGGDRSVRCNADTKTTLDPDTQARPLHCAACGRIARSLAVCCCAPLLFAQCRFLSPLVRTELHKKFGDHPVHGQKTFACNAFRAAGFQPFAHCSLENPKFADIFGGLDSFTVCPEDSLHTVRSVSQRCEASCWYCTA